MGRRAASTPNVSERSGERAPVAPARFVLVVVVRALLLPRARDAHAGAPALRRGRARAGSVAVGVAVGAFAVGAIALRPFAGGIGDTIGPAGADHRRRAHRRARRRCLYGLVARALVADRDARRDRHRRGRVLRRCRDDDHRPRAGRAARRGRQLLVGRGVRRARVRSRARRVLRGDGRYTLDVGWCRPGSRSSRRCIGLVHASRSPRERRDRRRRTSSTAPRSPGIVLFLGLIPLAGVQRVHAAVRRRAARRRRRADLPALRRADPRRAHRRRAPARSARAVARGHASRWRSRRRASAIIAAWPTVAGLVVGTVVFAVGMSLHVSGAACCSRCRRERRRARVGRRHVLVVLRPVARASARSSCGARRRAFARRPRARSPTGRGVAALGRARALLRRAARRTTSARHRRCRGRADAVVAGHERLPAQARRHPVVPLRAVAAAPARRDDRAHDAVPGRGGMGRAAAVPRRAHASSASCSRRARSPRRSTRSRARSRADVIFLDPMLPLGAARARASRAAPYVVVAHGAEITGYRPAARLRAAAPGGCCAARPASSRPGTYPGARRRTGRGPARCRAS